MLREILGPSDRKIVDYDDVVAVAKQAIDQVTSDETGAAGYDASHDRTYPLRSGPRPGLAIPKFCRGGLPADEGFCKRYQSVPGNSGRDRMPVKRQPANQALSLCNSRAISLSHGKCRG